MIFTGITRTFSTAGSAQYGTIGAFWDAMAEKYGRQNLRGLGYRWTEDTIEYAIGLKEGILPGSNCQISLPDGNWTHVTGKTARLGALYEEIYRSGALKYEIEMFTDEGDCEILYFR